MKITHRKVEVHPYKIKAPIDYLKISDPYYGKDVYCRYEKESLQMDSVKFLLNRESIFDEEYEFDYDFSELIISLSNSNCHGECSNKVNYEIGVDTARYLFQTEYDYAEIYTAADGFYGTVCEYYYGDKLGMIDIHLTVPSEHAITEQEFISSIAGAMNIKGLRFKTIMDEDVNIEISDKEPIKEMKMTS